MNFPSYNIRIIIYKSNEHLDKFWRNKAGGNNSQKIDGNNNNEGNNSKEIDGKNKGKRNNSQIFDGKDNGKWNNFHKNDIIDNNGGNQSKQKADIKDDLRDDNQKNIRNIIYISNWFYYIINILLYLIEIIFKACYY